MELLILVTTFVLASGLAGMPAISADDVESWVEAEQ